MIEETNAGLPPLEIELFIYGYLQDGQVTSFSAFMWKVNEESGHWVFVKKMTVPFTLPDGWDYRKEAVKAIDEAINKVRADSQNELTRLSAERSKVLSITFEG